MLGKERLDHNNNKPHKDAIMKKLAKVINIILFKKLSI